MAPKVSVSVDSRMSLLDLLREKGDCNFNF